MFLMLKKSKRNAAIFALLFGLCLVLSHFLLMTPFLDDKKKQRLSTHQLFTTIHLTEATTLFSNFKNENKMEISQDPELLVNRSSKLTKTIQTGTIHERIMKLVKIVNNNISTIENKKANRITTLPETSANKKSDLGIDEKVMHELRKLALGINSKFRILSGHGIDAYLREDYMNNVGIGKEFANKNNTRPDSCSACTNVNFTFLINNEKLCQKPLDLFIFIFSSPSNFIQRQAIRLTWGSLCGKQSKQIKCAFVLGNPQDDKISSQIKDENKKFKDILQIDFDDAYVNLTYKTLSSLKWFSKMCSSTKYVMKTDDDVYVNLELIPKMTHSLPKNNFLGGFCWGVSEPNRQSESKWYVPYHTFTGSAFPPMCSGTGYIMSNDFPKKILSISKNIPFFHLEDVYIALCAKRLGIRPTKLLGFHNEFVEFNKCNYRNFVMTSHQVNSYQMRTFWMEAHECSLNRTSLDHLFKPVPYPNDN